MKKLILVLAISLINLPLLAASTCEERVDKNVHKTTAERVKYCLDFDKTDLPDEEEEPEVIVSDTYSVQFPKEKKKTSQPAQKTIKTYKSQPTSMEYIDRTTYPPFRNDTLPRITSHQANETALQALQEQRAAQEKQKNAAKKSKASKKSTKPARKKADEAKPAKTQVEEAQVKQAEALQNDPLAQNNTNNGTTPPDFLEGGVLGPDDFGYNATDPAYQQ